MTTQASTPAGRSTAQGAPVVVDADYVADVSDTLLDIVAPGVLVTLPQNAQAGVTSMQLLAEQAFDLTAGALGGLGGDPVSVPEGTLLTATRGTSSWLLSGLAASPKLARNWAQGTLLVVGGAETIIASTVVTPESSGRLRVLITGSAVAQGDSGTSDLSLSVSHGAAATPVDYTAPGAFTVDNDLPFFNVAICLVVDLDIAAGLVLPVGAPVQINAVMQALTGSLAFRASLQIEVQEVPNPS